MNPRHDRRVIRLTLLAVASLFLCAARASGAYIPVYGGPTYSPSAGGHQTWTSAVNNAGTAVGYGEEYAASGFYMGRDAFRWNGSGQPPTQLGHLSLDSAGRTNVYAYAINNSGTVVGEALVVGPNNANYGYRAVRWSASSTVPTELGNLGVHSSGLANAAAQAINATGTAAGYADKFVTAGYLGTRAVRWEPSGTGATELGILDTSPNAYGDSEALAINNSGTVVGFVDDDVTSGRRAVRWDAGSTTATPLDVISATPNGNSWSQAVAVNGVGTAVGYGETYDGSGMYLGHRAVRWGPNGTAATILGILNTNPNGFTGSGAKAINEAGTAVGYAGKYDISGNEIGIRAVRWEASSTQAVELALPAGLNSSAASAINAGGVAVGYAGLFESYTSEYLAKVATMWGVDAAATDLNSLINPASGWVLSEAVAISDTGWITGNGRFDPDGPGGQNAYQRMWLMYVPAAIPEPATICVLLLAAPALRSRLRVPRFDC